MGVLNHYEKPEDWPMFATRGMIVFPETGLGAQTNERSRMTRENFLVELSQLLETDVRGPEELASLGNWDSMTAISLMAMADDRCGVTLAPKNINCCRTVNDLVELLLRRAGN
jgi:acyl carrier protein